MDFVAKVALKKTPGWLAAEGEERAVGWPGIFRLR